MYKTVFCGPSSVLITEVLCTGPCSVVPAVSSLQRFCVQDHVLWSQQCPHCRGSVYRTMFCGPSSVLITEVLCTGLCSVVPAVSSLQRFCVQDCVLWSQQCPHYRGSVYRTVFCDPSSVLITEVLCTGLCSVVPAVSSLQRFCVQDCVLWSQQCPHYRGSVYRTMFCGPSSVLITEVLCTGLCSVVPAVSSLQRL